MNGYNFTDRVRTVLQLAREEAARLHHEYVGTEHILLGLIREGQGVAVAALTNLNVDVEELSAAINETLKEGVASETPRDLPYTSRAKKILELSMTAARELNHSYVGTEHLLLGSLLEAKGIAAQTCARSRSGGCATAGVSAARGPSVQDGNCADRASSPSARVISELPRSTAVPWRERCAPAQVGSVREAAGRVRARPGSRAGP